MNISRIDLIAKKTFKPKVKCYNCQQTGYMSRDWPQHDKRKSNI